jgi:hypothetical protein
MATTVSNDVNVAYINAFDKNFKSYESLRCILLSIAYVREEHHHTFKKFAAENLTTPYQSLMRWSTPTVNFVELEEHYGEQRLIRGVKSLAKLKKHWLTMKDGKREANKINRDPDGAILRIEARFVYPEEYL